MNSRLLPVDLLSYQRVVGLKVRTDYEQAPGMIFFSGISVGYRLKAWYDHYKQYGSTSQNFRMSIRRHLAAVLSLALCPQTEDLSSAMLSGYP